MPKVNPEYFRQKKESILDAAYAVCQKKPLFEVTMKDIIRESGLSQGGIYRYYASVDEILVDVMNRNSLADYRRHIDGLAESGGKQAEAVRALLGFLAGYIENNSATLGKFHFELIELLAYQPERVKTISVENMHMANTQHFINSLYAAIRKGADSWEFTPALPLGDILSFVSASIDGIVLGAIFSRCYGLKKQYEADASSLIHTLEASLLRLLCPGNTEI